MRLLAVLLLSGLSAASAELSLPPPAPVVDEYGLLAESQRANLDSMLRNAKRKSGVEISIFIPGSLRGLEIEEFSIAAVEAWKLGRKKEDKAFLLTVAPRERKMRIEVGYGLEGQLTDAFSRQILENTLRPYFREGKYYEGILASLLKIQEKIPLGLDSDAVFYDDGVFPIPPVVWVLFLVLAGFVFLAAISRRLRPGGRYPYYDRGYDPYWTRSNTWGSSSSSSWSSGSGWSGRSGGSWGGGGGGFGGGGASSNW